MHVCPLGRPFRPRGRGTSKLKGCGAFSVAQRRPSALLSYFPAPTRAQEIPLDEREMDPAEDKVVQVRHIYQDAHLSNVLNFGDPLLIVLTPQDTLLSLTRRIQQRLKMSDAEMAKLKVGLVTFSRIEPIADSEPQSARSVTTHVACSRGAGRQPAALGARACNSDNSAHALTTAVLTVARAPLLRAYAMRRCSCRRADELVKGRFRAQDNQQSGSWEDYIGIEHPAAPTGPGARRRNTTRYHDKPVKIYG